MIIATPTHVYVRNCTPLRFEVSIDYEGATNPQQNFCQNGASTIAPYDLPEEKNMVLEIDRLMTAGEHIYTIKLINGAEILYLKQKLVCKSAQTESELGISLASACLHDPWFMNSQAKERHEHLLSINGRNIVVVYYAYDNNNNEDIEYTLYERLPASLDVTNQVRICSKTLAYSLSIPVNPSSCTKAQPYELINIAPKTIQPLGKAIMATKSHQAMHKDHSTLSMPSHLALNTHSNKWRITDLQKIITFVYPQDQSMPKDTTNSTILKSIQPIAIQGQEIIDYIAQKKSWYSGYSVEDSKPTQYWVPRNKMTAN